MPEPVVKNVTGLKVRIHGILKRARIQRSQGTGGLQTGGYYFRHDNQGDEIWYYIGWRGNYISEPFRHEEEAIRRIEKALKESPVAELIDGVIHSVHGQPLLRLSYIKRAYN